jgi:protein transport protein SEC13
MFNNFFKKINIIYLNISNMEEIDQIQTEISGDICTIEIDYYGTKLAIGDVNGKIYIFQNTNNSMSKIAEISSHFGPIYKLSWSHPSFGPLLASAGFDKKVILYKFENNRLEELYTYNNHENSVKSLKFSPSSKNLLLISGCLNGDIVSCEYYNNQFNINKIFAHDFGVNVIDFLDEFNFITTGNDNTIKIWNYNNQGDRGEIKKIVELKDEINNMVISDLSCKDNTHFVCCGESNGEGVVNYWTLNDEKKWEAKEIYKQKEKLEKIKFNEEHTCIVVVDEEGQEHIILENEL